MNAVVLSFDYLPLGMLGCYGNGWVETPQFDRLAAAAVTFDNCYGTEFDAALDAHIGRRPRSEPARDAWWTGRPPGKGPRRTAGADDLTVIDILGRKAATELIFENASAGPAAWPRFDRIRGVTGPETRETSTNEFPLAQLITAGCEALAEGASSDRPRLLWLRSRGIPSPVLPPGEWADLYLDEMFDEDDSDSDADFDFDRVLAELLRIGGLHRGRRALSESDARLAQAIYAAYVTWLDSQLGRLLDLLDERPDPNRLLIVTAAAGDWGVFSPPSASRPLLIDELVHVPLFLRVGEGERLGSRRGELVQVSDLPATLLEWFGLPSDAFDDGSSLLPIVGGTQETHRPQVVFGSSETGWGIRTANFLLVPDSGNSAANAAAGDSLSTAETGSSTFRLFRKPEDVWDTLDVADQYHTEVERLIARSAD